MDKALFNIFDLPMVMTSFVGFILASVLLISQPKMPRHLSLAGYLYALSCVELAKVIFWSMPLHRLFEPLIPVIFAIGSCIGLWVPPLLYLYISGFDKKESSLSPWQTWIILIPIISILLAVTLYQSLGNDPSQYALSNYHRIFFDPVFLAMLIAKYGIFFGFAGLCLKTSSRAEGELNLVFVGALCIYGFEFATDVMAMFKTDGSLLNNMGIFHNYMVLAYVCLMLVYMLKQRFSIAAYKVKKTSTAARKLMDQEVSKIHQLMMEHKYYLDADISLETLARKLKMPEY